MNNLRDYLKRFAVKLLPLIISLISTVVIFSILFDYYPVIGNVTTEVIAVWI